MSENYSNPKITNPIIPPQPSEYIEEYTEPVQEPKDGGGEEGGGNDKPTPNPDSGKTQPKPEEETHQEEEAPKPEETEPKEEDDEEGGLEEQNPIEDKDDAQGNFFEDNKGLLTRVYNILKLRFPNSNVSLPQLLTGAQQYIDMIAAPPGGGQGGGEDDDEEGYDPHYYIYIDNQKEPVEDGEYPQTEGRVLWDFVVKKCIDLFWVDKEKQRFNANYIKQKDNNKWLLRTIKIKFKDVYGGYDLTPSKNEVNFKNDVNDNDDNDELSDFMKQMWFMHHINAIVYPEELPTYKENSFVYEFNFFRNGTEDDIKHAFEQAKKENSRIKNELKDTTVNNKNIAKYLNAVYRESKKHMEEIINSAKGSDDTKKYVFDKIVKEFSYDDTGYDKHYNFGNDMQAALATNSAQCYGYANAFFTITNRLGINIKYIHCREPYKHAWNYEKTQWGNENPQGLWYDACFQSTPGQDDDYYYKFKNDRRGDYKNAKGVNICDLSKDGIPIFQTIPDEESSYRRRNFFELFRGVSNDENKPLPETRSGG